MVPAPDQCGQAGSVPRAHRDLAALEIDILDAQVQSLQQAHPGAVQETDNQPARAFQLREQRTYLVLREHNLLSLFLLLTVATSSLQGAWLNPLPYLEKFKVFDMQFGT